jgi:hypothetical protein
MFDRIPGIFPKVEPDSHGNGERYFFPHTFIFSLYVDVEVDDVQEIFCGNDK